jgi:hypothetical protein
MSSSSINGFESIEHNGIRYAEVLWATATVPVTRFFSPASSSFQFGLLAHGAGFTEAAHYHKPIARQITDLQQMFVVQRGIVVVELYTNDGELFREIELKAGDAIVLVHGIHAIRVVEDMQCVSIKQGPFLGDQNDKIDVEVKG